MSKDTTWVEELERAITIRQITKRMDGWTRKVGQAREYGYSWKEIAAWSGLNEQTAKKRFEYGLEKNPRNIVRLLRGGNPQKSGCGQLDVYSRCSGRGSEKEASLHEKGDFAQGERLIL